MLPLKRKRAVVSYAELADGDFEDMLDDDTDFGSRKVKKSKRNIIRETAVEVTKTHSKPFPFLDLPSEIRNTIYELALTAPEELKLVSKYKSSRHTVKRGTLYEAEPHCDHNTNHNSNEEQRSHLIPNLLAVCKQIHSEAIGYLYKQTFILQDTKALHTFLIAIGPSNRLILNNVVLKDWGTGRGIHKAMNFASMSLLSTCTNLQSLHVDCSLGWYNEPKQLALHIFRAAHYFFEAFGAAKGRRDAGVDILRLKECNFGDCSVARSVYPEREVQNRKREFGRELRKILLT